MCSIIRFLLSCASRSCPTIAPSPAPLASSAKAPADSEWVVVKIRLNARVKAVQWRAGALKPLAIQGNRLRESRLTLTELGEPFERKFPQVGEDVIQLLLLLAHFISGRRNMSIFVARVASFTAVNRRDTGVYRYLKGCQGTRGLVSTSCLIHESQPTRQASMPTRP